MHIGCEIKYPLKYCANNFESVIGLMSEKAPETFIFHQELELFEKRKEL